MVLETWAVKRYDIAANVYVDRQIQQFQKILNAGEGRGTWRRDILCSWPSASPGLLSPSTMSPVPLLCSLLPFTQRCCLAANITGPLLSARSSRVSGL